MSEPTMPDADVSKLAQLAVNPEEGTPFEFGGKTFKLQFLTCEGERKLVELLKPRIQALAESGETGHAQVMRAINDLLPQSVAIILNDYDGETDEAWVRAVRGRGLTLKMYDLVAAQFEMNELGKLLLGLLQNDVMLSAMADKAA